EEEQLKPRWDLDLEVQRLASGFPAPEGGSQGRPGPSMVDADSVNTEAGLGCPFYLRCPVAVERCLHSHPPLMELRDSQHAVRCHVAHAELQDRLNSSEELA